MLAILFSFIHDFVVDIWYSFRFKLPLKVSIFVICDFFLSRLANV